MSICVTGLSQRQGELANSILHEGVLSANMGPKHACSRALALEKRLSCLYGIDLE